MGWADKLGDMIPVNRDEWWKAMKNQKRVAVIDSACLLDKLLDYLLELIFMRWNEEVRNQFNPSAGGSLAYLTQKARLIYSLGYIDKTTLVDLKKISKIRNRFAHNINITFTDAKVCEIVSNLSVAKDSKVTTKNKYSIYTRTVTKCWEAISAGIEQAVIRKAVLKQSDKEKKR
jgi:DNA-binding MltR family transcriptional regulator